MEWIEQDRFDQEGLKSQFHFMPKSSKDYGNLYCIGENAIGTQEEPCIFNIVPTGKSILPPIPFVEVWARPSLVANRLVISSYFTSVLY